MTHTPVLVDEVLALFQTQDGDRLLDATLGHGGHAAAYLAAADATTVVGLDADPDAITQARHNLKQFADRVTYINDNFSNLTHSINSGSTLSGVEGLNDALTGGGIVKGDSSTFQHILFDLGLGSHQLSDSCRGFSFKSQGPLRMRYGVLHNMPDSRLPAVNHLTKYLGHYPDAIEVLVGLTQDQLAELILNLGEERYARRIAQVIKDAPEPLRTADALAETIVQATPSSYERGRIHPATRTFQALRLAVNRELEALTAALPQAVELLKPQGVLAVISFHSLEDRIVKHFLRQHEHLDVLTKKPIRAGQEEISRNLRARSAKLRAAKLKKIPKHDTNHHSKRNTSSSKL